MYIPLANQNICISKEMTLFYTSAATVARAHFATFCACYLLFITQVEHRLIDSQHMAYAQGWAFCH